MKNFGSIMMMLFMGVVLAFAFIRRLLRHPRIVRDARVHYPVDIPPHVEREFNDEDLARVTAAHEKKRHEYVKEIEDLEMQAVIDRYKAAFGAKK